MTFRKAEPKDIAQIMEIIRQAQNYLKEQKVEQWQDGYPNEGSIAEDIQNGVTYVYEAEDRLLGTLALIFGTEPTYAVIHDGAWETEGIPYATIHRIAIADDVKGRGIAGEMLAEAERICRENKVHTLRIDTHEDNKSMQAWIKKNHFFYCGWIIVANGDKRLAYEKRLERDRRDMYRTGWKRFLEKEYTDSKCEFHGRKARVSLSVFKKLTAPLWVSDRDRKVLIADTDYSWLQLAVDGEYFYMTSMFDAEGKLHQLYFDITNGIIWDDPENPKFDDMYLDVVLSADGYVEVLDEDELTEAYQENIISKAEYVRTLEEGQKLKEYLENHAQEMMEFCREWYRKLCRQ